MVDSLNSGGLHTPPPSRNCVAPPGRHCKKIVHDALAHRSLPLRDVPYKAEHYRY